MIIFFVLLSFNLGFLVASVLGSAISVGSKNVVPTLPLYLPTQNERLEEQV
jgi:hypothetical protein